jgi:hypothetical protein
MRTLLPVLFLGVAVLATGCGKKTEATAATNAPTRYDTGNPLTAPADYLGAVGQAQRFSEKQIDIAYITQAIQLFQAGEGRNPASIDELVQLHYLGKTPDVPFGYQLIYDATNATVKVTKK